jgi:hypothetical protein
MKTNLSALIQHLPRRHRREWRYSSTVALVGNALATLFLSKELPVSIGYVHGWVPEPVWTQWQREKNPCPSVIEPLVFK